MNAFRCQLLVLILGIIAFLVVLYLQYFQGILACPLCVLQRVALLIAMIISIVALLHRPRRWGWWVYQSLTGLIAVGGVIVAGRQVWLQHFPPGQAPGCGAGFDQLVETFSFTRALVLVFKGTGDCAIVHGHFLGLTIAGWSVVLFAIIIALMVVGAILQSLMRQTLNT